MAQTGVTARSRSVTELTMEICEMVKIRDAWHRTALSKARTRRKRCDPDVANMNLCPIASWQGSANLLSHSQITTRDSVLYSMALWTLTMVLHPTFHAVRPERSKWFIMALIDGPSLTFSSGHTHTPSADHTDTHLPITQTSY